MDLFLILSLKYFYRAIFEEQQKEVAELKEKVKNADLNHQKQIVSLNQAAKVMADKFTQERAKLQR